MFKRLDGDRLVGLFVVGCLLFGYPLMGLWDRPVTIAGIPLFPLAIFGCWAGLIAALAWLMTRVGSADVVDQDDEPEIL